MKTISITNTHYINLIDGRFFISDNQYEGTDIVALDVIRTANDDFPDIPLSAAFTQYLTYYPDLRIATFHGICPSIENVFQICDGDEAHNIDNIFEAMVLWGLNGNLVPYI